MFPKAFAFFFAAIFSIALFPQAASAEIVVRVKNNTTHCAWFTWYSKFRLEDWEIIRYGWVRPHQEWSGGDGRDVYRIKVRAEVMPGEKCSGSSSDSIDDVEYVTDVHNDMLYLIKRSGNKFQLKR